MTFCWRIKNNNPFESMHEATGALKELNPECLTIFWDLKIVESVYIHNISEKSIMFMLSYPFIVLVFQQS